MILQDGLPDDDSDGLARNQDVEEATKERNGAGMEQK